MFNPFDFLFSDPLFNGTLIVQIVQIYKKNWLLSQKKKLSLTKLLILIHLLFNFSILWFIDSKMNWLIDPFD